MVVRRDAVLDAALGTWSAGEAANWKAGDPGPGAEQRSGGRLLTRRQPFPRGRDEELVQVPLRDTRSAP